MPGAVLHNLCVSVSVALPGVQPTPPALPACYGTGPIIMVTSVGAVVQSLATAHQHTNKLVSPIVVSPLLRHY